MKRFVALAALLSSLAFNGRALAQFISHSDQTPAPTDIRASNCFWADEKQQPVESVMGYNVNACGPNSPPVLICSGTARCNLSVPSKVGGERRFVALLNNV